MQSKRSENPRVFVDCLKRAVQPRYSLLELPEYRIGNISRVLKGEMPEIARAEDKDKAKQVWELIYKRRNYSKRETIPQNRGQDPWHSSPWTLPHSLLPVTTARMMGAGDV